MLLLLGEGCDSLASFVDAAPFGVDGAIFVPSGKEPFFYPILVFDFFRLLTIVVPVDPRFLRFKILATNGDAEPCIDDA